MLDNTQIFETAENKELDALLKKYSDLKVLIADYTTTQKQCADRIKELCNKKGGKYETLNAVFDLVERAGKTEVDTPKLQANYSDIWDKVPSDCLSIKVGNLKKYKDIWNEVPTECLIIGEPTLAMGDIVFKTKI